MHSLQKILRVAQYELHDALRSKRFVVVLILYILGAGGACFGLITILHKLELELAGALGLSASNHPGAVAEALWQSVTFQRMARRLVGDSQVAQELLSIPPVALVYAWLAFTFTPILVLLTTPSRIAEDVASGYARFSLVRVSRTEWCLGKYLGQALEIIIPLMLSAMSAWGVARFRLYSMAGMDVIAAMIIYGWKVWVYCLAFSGLSLGVSQVCRSPNQATALALMVWGGLAAAKGGLSLIPGELGPRAFSVLHLLTPAGHKLDLWRANPAYVLPAMVYLVAIGAVFFAIGHVVFLKKDM